MDNIALMSYDHGRYYISYPSGGVPEWTIGTVLKTVECKSSVSSNLTPSARVRKGVFNETGNDLFLPQG